MTAIKICGITRLEHAQTAVEAGAAMLGFVFAPSRRRIEPETARAIAAEVRRCSEVRVVGIFVDSPVEEINEIALRCELDLVQLSGDEDDSIIASLTVPAIKTIHVSPGDGAETLLARAAGTSAHFLHLDTAHAGMRGGTGSPFDWTRVPGFDRPVILAGGLHAGNVAAAIRAVQPWAVDVSSGVETAGEKDAGRMRAFVAAVRMDRLAIP